VISHAEKRGLVQGKSECTSKESTQLMKGHTFYLGDSRINCDHDWK